MKANERLGVVALAIRMLNEVGSWTGRMHIQKLVYLAERLLDLDTDYEFVLYQRGPYSFDLDEDIRLLRSIQAVDIVPSPPYGPKYMLTRSGESLAGQSPIPSQKAEKLRQLAGLLGAKPARDLELLATCLYVIGEAERSDEEAIERVRGLKPHFTAATVNGGLQEVRDLQQRF